MIKPKLDLASILPLATKLGEHIKTALDTYVGLRAAGQEINADLLAGLVVTQISGWHPKANGKDLLADDETRQACARFIAGIIINLCR